MEISSTSKIPMSMEISSTTPGNKQSKTVVHTTSAEKQFPSKTSFICISYSFCAQYQEGVGREIK